MYSQSVIVYFADDGKEFFDEKKCLEYERKKYRENIKDLNVKIWDENFVKLPLNEETNFDDICYFKCETDKDFDKFNKIALFVICSRLSEKTNLFFYCEDRGEFITPDFYETDVDIHYLAAKKFLAEEK